MENPERTVFRRPIVPQNQMLGPAGITLALSTFSNSAFLVWMFALTLFVWVPVYYFALYRKQKAATIERIRNSAEYQQQCTAARVAANRQQQEFDEAYTKAKEEYDSVLLPRYQAARSAWEAEHQAQIRKEEQEGTGGALRGDPHCSGTVPAGGRPAVHL